MALPVLLRTVTELEATPELPKSYVSAFKERGGPLYLRRPRPGEALFVVA
jgi:hypothetical protein